MSVDYTVESSRTNMFLDRSELAHDLSSGVLPADVLNAAASNDNLIVGELIIDAAERLRTPERWRALRIGALGATALNICMLAGGEQVSTTQIAELAGLNASGLTNPIIRAAVELNYYLGKEVLQFQRNGRGQSNMFRAAGLLLREGRKAEEIPQIQTADLQESFDWALRRIPVNKRLPTRPKPTRPTRPTGPAKTTSRPISPPATHPSDPPQLIETEMPSEPSSMPLEITVAAPTDREIDKAASPALNHESRNGGPTKYGELLSAAQEVELAKRIEAGVFADARLQMAADSSERLAPQLHRELLWLARDGRRAKYHFFAANEGLVHVFANRYVGSGLDREDLEQEGSLGLMKAVERFDYAQGNKFSTFAFHEIRSAITRAIEEKSRTIRLPSHVALLVDKLYRTQRDMSISLSRVPTIDELAQELELSTEKVNELLQLKNPKSLDELIGLKDSDDGVTRGERVEDASVVPQDEQIIAADAQEALKSVLATLEAREAGVIKMLTGIGTKTGQPLTHSQIAKAFDTTAAHIRQIEARTMDKLRHPSRSQYLGSYFD